MWILFWEIGRRKRERKRTQGRVREREREEVEQGEGEIKGGGSREDCHSSNTVITRLSKMLSVGVIKFEIVKVKTNCSKS